jgi:hypothetical protein
MRYSFLVVALFGFFAGCAKEVDLPQITVGAADASEFARFRSDLATQFPVDRLQTFDTAVQELKLDAMNRDIPTAAARERSTLALINGKSVQAVSILGWEARHARFLREIAFIQGMLDRDLVVQKNAGPGGPSSVVLARIQSAQNVIAQTQRHDANTQQRLTELRVTESKQGRP